MLLQRARKFTEYIPLPWLVSGILMLCFFAFVLQPNADRDAQHADGNTFPQFYMKNLHTQEFNTAGTLSHQIRTPLVTFYQPQLDNPATDYSLITTPNMIFYPEDQGQPWYISATSGRNDQQQLRFDDDVRIEQDSLTHGKITITTSELYVRTQEQFALSDKAVTMRSPKGQMNAVGMKADLTNSRIELTSQVKSVYEPR
jgi:lipopolysaccharide export system protein LptC